MGVIIDQHTITFFKEIIGIEIRIYLKFGFSQGHGEDSVKREHPEVIDIRPVFYFAMEMSKHIPSLTEHF